MMHRQLVCAVGLLLTIPGAFAIGATTNLPTNGVDTLRSGQHRKLSTGADVKAAVDAANDGDVIVLQDGNYSITETVTITKDLVIRAENYGNVILDAAYDRRLMVIGNDDTGKGPTVELKGLMLTKGETSNENVGPSGISDNRKFDGGCLHISGADTVVNLEEVAIFDCHTNRANNNPMGYGQTYHNGDGGGMAVWSGTVNMNKCEVTGNIGGHGGGIAAWNGDSPKTPIKMTLTDCEITGNFATGAGGGYITYSGTHDFDRCTFSGNHVLDHHYGGGLRMQGNTGGDDTVVTLRNTVFTLNSANSEGGAFSSGGGTTTLIGCNVSDNFVTGKGDCYNCVTHPDKGRGAGFSLHRGNEPGYTVHLIDTTFANNTGFTQVEALTGPSHGYLRGQDASGQDSTLCKFGTTNLIDDDLVGTNAVFDQCTQAPTQIPSDTPTTMPSITPSFGPDTTTTAAPKTQNGNGLTSNANGDPHFLGGHGGSSDFRGHNNTWYVMLSTQNASVALLFLLDEYWWRKKRVYGSWMKAVAIVSTTNNQHILHAFYHVDAPSSVTTVVEEGKAQVVGLGDSLELEGIQLRLSHRLVFFFSNGAWAIEAKNRALPYKQHNGAKRRLDLAVRPIGDVDQDPIAPHGLLGQTYDRDDMRVIGALDNYEIPGKVIVTKAQAEGAIEGVAADYVINQPFSTNFKFSRFGMTGHAAPRNLTSLSGVKLPAKLGLAGALNDEPDA